MKKSIIASIVALGMASGMAQAAVNEVQFHGNVTTVTCDLTPSVDGSLNPNGPGLIELGDAKVGGEGKVVSFAFKPVSDAQNVAACNAIANDAAINGINLTWTGSKFGSAGLGALDGSAAADSHVEIKPINSKTQNATFVKASGETNSFERTVLLQGGDGLKYEAVLKAGQTAGDFKAAATFNMTYN
ncbi:hypothetical protein [Escherichia coli]|uniref:hypothetical protein n=1 Tax=Escherichia coli TaxID=562 RepID=UPI000B7DB70D|nr:hypothetical protein [Escherichia coli]